jgi:hypothetical protein
MSIHDLWEAYYYKFGRGDNKVNYGVLRAAVRMNSRVFRYTANDDPNLSYVQLRTDRRLTSAEKLAIAVCHVYVQLNRKVLSANRIRTNSKLVGSVYFTDKAVAKFMAQRGMRNLVKFQDDKTITILQPGSVLAYAYPQLKLEL